MSDAGGGSCAERSGFLFAHDCDQPVVANCSGCNKPICRRHARPTTATSTTSANAAATDVECIECRKSSQTATSKRRSRSTDDDDDPYDYSLLYYSNYHYYDDRDRRAFDRDDGTVSGGLEGDFDGS